MRALNIIESVYNGTPYKESEKVLVDPTDVNLAFRFKSSRFTVESKLNSIDTVPYEVTFEKYCELLTRVKIIAGRSMGNLNLYSKPEEFEPFIAEYGSSNAVITEPLMISDLMYSHDELSPLGLLALMFRKSYGNDRFKRYINSTLLKSYKKIKLGGGPNVYLRPDCEPLLQSALNFKSYGMSWEDINEFLIKSPFIFIWRD